MEDRMRLILLLMASFCLNFTSAQILSCHKNAICFEFDNWQDERSGVLKLDAGTGGYPVAYMVNNTDNDGRKLLMARKSAFDPGIAVDDIVSVTLTFGYESSTCDPTTSATGQVVTGDVKVLAFSTLADRILLEIMPSVVLPSITITFLGWSIETPDGTSLDNNNVVFGFPVGELKRGAGVNYVSYSTPDIVGQVTNVGAVEVGYIGSPLLDASGRVRGDLTVQNNNGCGNPQSSLTFKEFGDDWGTFVAFLDPGGGAITCDKLAVALPVELKEFTATVTGQLVTLKWVTATEVNNYGFKVERLTAGEWDSLGFVSGAGNSNKTTHYIFYDKPGAGKYSYRLCQMDNDGAVEYSPTIEVEIVVVTGYSLANFPNPFNGQTEITFNLPASSEVTLEIYNSLGNLIETINLGSQPMGEHSYRFGSSNLSSGVYYCRLKTTVVKMILLK
ncbi:MAG: T9SS type A sorting domain-containing protein [Candidatus Komeilibacteria bacterium]|nr:T9SS type A sorting domain-containing protein [Candidatus Komeilibacteria bacterium]